MSNYANLIVLGSVFFIILISIQYSLNKLVLLLKEIKEILIDIQNRYYK